MQRALQSIRPPKTSRPKPIISDALNDGWSHPKSLPTKDTEAGVVSFIKPERVTTSEWPKIGSVRDVHMDIDLFKELVHLLDDDTASAERFLFEK